MTEVGEKLGDGGLRGAPKECLLEVGLRHRVLRKESNSENVQYWQVVVEEEGFDVHVDY